MAQSQKSVMGGLRGIVLAGCPHDCLDKHFPLYYDTTIVVTIKNNELR